VYKDENGESRYDPLKDIPIVGATVKASNKEAASVTTDVNGKYALDVSPGATYYLDVSIETAIQTYDPDLGEWATHSPITGKQTVNVPSNSAPQIEVDIAVKYSILNYSPNTFSYRVWHSGPIFMGRPNTILVHGAVIPGQWHNQTTPNNCFPTLSHLLQSKIHGQHNVWEFEYADQCTDTSAHTGCSNYGDLIVYGTELRDTINAIRAWNPDNGVNIVAHSLGGLVARYAVQHNDTPTKATKNMITLDTGHFGFNLAAFAQLLSNAPVVQEVRPGSKFLNDLIVGFQHGKCRLLSLAASAPCIGLGVVSWTSSRLVQIKAKDGSTSYDHTNTPFFIVDNVDHMSIVEINNANHPTFQQIKNFLGGGAVPQQAFRPGYPWQVDPYFTVVMHERPQPGYPKLLSEQNLPLQTSNDPLVDEASYYAAIFNVKNDPSSQNIKIEHPPQFLDGYLTHRQSSIRTIEQN
jgi:pimeloyl-ACP methyl ester carboxylesterase